ncbi:Hypothetical protein NCS54_00922800 [Fusarium falciforme]|uniref:Hypothetical protein n=1 Tax=Fusarium falciforme TaxID=195108 RepID=UPI002300C263|nr:Hypothetical protein NCS54_00922800 [Fusarium falciforme]WAO91747.1 Hypothetical protein NCS54_00922800 [Fusarium falciforme]
MTSAAEPVLLPSLASYTMRQNRGWAGEFPPKRWTPNMVQSLARVIRHVARGANDLGDKHTLEDVKVFIIDRVNLRARNAPFRPSDITDAMSHFGVTRNKSETVPDEKKVESRRISRVGEEDEEDKKAVDDSISDTKQHIRAAGTNDEHHKDDDGRTSTLSKATASPVPMSNSNEKIAKETNSSQPKETNTDNDAPRSPSTSSTKRNRTEDVSPGPDTTALDRPAKRPCLSTSKPTANNDSSTPLPKDTATTVTKEQDMATFRAVVNRRRAESSHKHTTLEHEFATFEEDVERRIDEAEQGSIAVPSASTLTSCKMARSNLAGNLQRLHQTVQYRNNNDLLATIDFETRTMIAKDHERRLCEMQKQLDKAEAEVRQAKRKVKAEREEAERLVWKDVEKGHEMEAEMERACTERDRWRCIEHIAAMNDDDLHKAMRVLEKEGLGLTEDPE